MDEGMEISSLYSTLEDAWLYAFALLKCSNKETSKNAEKLEIDLSEYPLRHHLSSLNKALAGLESRYALHLEGRRLNPFIQAWRLSGHENLQAELRAREEWDEPI